MNLTIFGAFLKDPAGEVSARIPAFGNVKQEEISRVIKSSPLPCTYTCTAQSSSESMQKVSTPYGYKNMIWI